MFKTVESTCWLPDEIEFQERLYSTIIANAGGNPDNKTLPDNEIKRYTVWTTERVMKNGYSYEALEFVRNLYAPSNNAQLFNIAVLRNFNEFASREDAEDWYEDKQPGLDKLFVTELSNGHLLVLDQKYAPALEWDPTDPSSLDKVLEECSILL